MAAQSLRVSSRVSCSPGTRDEDLSNVHSISESFSSDIVWTATASGGTKSFTRAKIVPAQLAERVCCTKFQSLLLNNYLRLGGFQSPLLPTYFCDGLNRCSHITKVWHKTYPIWHAPLSRSARRRFAPPQKPRRHSRSFLWTEALLASRYGFRSGAKALRYRVNITLRTSAWEAVNVQA